MKSSSNGVAGQVSPSVRKALGALATLLEDHHYSQHAREQIVAHTAREGTPTGCPYLDAEDERRAEMAFVEGLDPVPYDAPEWGPPEVAPIAGGAPYEPTAEDLEDYHRWSEELDRREEIRQLEARCNPQWGYE